MMSRITILSVQAKFLHKAEALKGFMKPDTILH